MAEGWTRDRYWILVEQLMHQGWYRLNIKGPRADGDRVLWGFRQGHLLDAPHEDPMWIAAQDQCTAMSVLLNTIKEEGQDRQSQHGRAS